MSETKVAIVTGASAGIGEATAKRLARDGWRVTLAARREDELGRVAGEIMLAGGRALPLATDVTDRDQIGRLAAETLAAWGRVDALVNNAGLGYEAAVADLDPRKLREQVAVNLVAVIECSQAILPTMIAQHSGYIINLASIAGLIGLPKSSVYCATKAGVIGFSESLRREMRPHGIHVTAFCPGFVATDFSPRLRRIRECGPGVRRLPGVMTADYVAGKIAAAIQRPRRRVIVPPGWGALAWVAETFPWLTDAVLARFLR